MSFGIWVLVGAVGVGVLLSLLKTWVDGRFRGKVEDVERVSAAEVGGELGERATLLQFSSAFCAPCRATRRTLAEVEGMVDGVRHVELDAESHLELVRRLDILRTPTTLVLDSTGAVVKRASGAPRKPDVIAALATAIEHQPQLRTSAKCPEWRMPSHLGDAVAVSFPAGWYDDPQDPTQQRYWDGSTWTDQRRAQQGPPPYQGQFGQPASTGQPQYGQPAQHGQVYGGAQPGQAQYGAPQQYATASAVPAAGAGLPPSQDRATRRRVMATPASGSPPLRTGSRCPAGGAGCSPASSTRSSSASSACR